MPDPLALVPVKTSARAKVRLAHILGAEARNLLVRALFDHVCDVLTAAGLRVVALSADRLPVPEGAESWREERPGLNAALRFALARTSEPVLIVPADLPWLSEGDVRSLLETPGDVVVARARDSGTAGLLLRRRIAPHFGPSSALAHAHAARRMGLTARVVRLPGFEDDLDDERGLRRAAAASPAAPRLTSYGVR